MLNEEMKELLKNLGFEATYDENNTLRVNSIKYHNEMNVSINREIPVDGILEKITCDNAEECLIVYTSILNLENGEKRPIIHEVEAKNHDNDEFLQSICDNKLLLISKGKFINDEKLIERQYSIIYDNGVLIIYFGEKKGLVYDLGNNFMLSKVSDEQILNVFSEDERLLALVAYYSHFYPDLLECITNLTQNIVSKSTPSEDYSRKRKTEINQ